MPTCDGGNQYGWPQFNNQAALQADSQWSKYFQLVYGEVPSSGYPICTFGFYFIHYDLMQKAGINKQLGRQGSMGSLYMIRQEFGGNLYMIYHGSGNKQGFQSNKWIEGAHCRTGGETAGAWYWYMPGSGFWMWSGKTEAFQHRTEAYQKYLGRSHCSDFQCGGTLFTTAHDKFGIDSVQYTDEHVNTCTFMFILTQGVGRNTCGASQCTWKAGWAASKACNCDQSQSCQNCQGFGQLSSFLGNSSARSPCIV